MMVRLSRIAFVAIATSVLVLSASAGADIAPSPPSHCPPGALGKTTRFAGWCAASECTTDADCAPQVDVDYGISEREQNVTYACQSAGLCIETVELNDSKRRALPGSDASLPTTPRDNATKACTDDTACTSGVKCSVAKRCLEATRTYKDDGGAVPFFKPQAVLVVARARDHNGDPVAIGAGVPRSTGKCGCFVGMESTADVPWFLLLGIVPITARVFRRPLRSRRVVRALS